MIIMVAFNFINDFSDFTDLKSCSGKLAEPHFVALLRIEDNPPEERGESNRYVHKNDRGRALGMNRKIREKADTEVSKSGLTSIETRTKLAGANERGDIGEDLEPGKTKSLLARNVSHKDVAVIINRLVSTLVLKEVGEGTSFPLKGRGETNEGLK